MSVHDIYRHTPAVGIKCVRISNEKECGFMVLKVKKLGVYQYSANYIYKAHAHPEYEINYVNSGRCAIVMGHDKIVLHRGDCVAIEPMREHSFIVIGAQECQITQFEFRADLPAEAMHSGYNIKMTNCSDILASLNLIRFYYKGPHDADRYYEKLCTLEMQKLFLLISMHAQQAVRMYHSCEVAPLNRVLEYIDSHYEQPIELDVLARENHISSRYLRRLFSKYMNVSAVDYITMLQVERAKDLLWYTDDTISEVAIKVGYNSPQYFTAVFKKKTGVTPWEFRRRFASDL